MAPFLRLFHFLAFAVPFAVFTYFLLVPVPPRPKVPEPWMLFVINKAAHASGFAYLTIVGSLFFRTPRHRWFAVAFMMLHGIGTEIGQTYTGRHGCIQDVLIDWAGVAAGVFATGRISRFLRREKSAAEVSTGSRLPVSRPE